MPRATDRLVQDILTVDRILDREIDLLAEEFEDELGPVVRRALRRLMPRLAALDQADGALKPTVANARRVFGVDAQFRRALIEAGLDDALEDAVGRYTRVVKISARASSATPRAKSVLEAFVMTKRLELQAAFDDLAARVGTLVRQAVIGGQDLTEVLVETQELLASSVRRARGAYDTSLAQLAQVVAASGEGSGPEAKFLYSGPIDARCRTWCLERVGRVYAKRTIDRMDNGQLPNTFLTRGGYNCRHHWRPVAGTPLDAYRDGQPVPQLREAAQRLFATMPSRPAGRYARV